MGSHIFHDFCRKICTRIWSNLSWLSTIYVDAIVFSCSNEPKQQAIILHKSMLSTRTVYHFDRAVADDDDNDDDEQKTNNGKL